MELIGCIRYMENGLAGYPSRRGKNKSTRKGVRSVTPDGKKPAENNGESCAEYAMRLGQKLDTSA